MGKRGPAKTPTALVLLRGNPGHRAINKDEPKPPVVEATSEHAKCPEWLAKHPLAKEVWERVAEGAMKCGLLTVVDLPVFEMMCMTYARWRTAEELSGDNLELAIAKGYRNTAVKERQIMLQLCSRFGFDPSSRSNVKTVAPKDITQTKLTEAERFMAEGE